MGPHESIVAEPGKGGRERGRRRVGRKGERGGWSCFFLIDIREIVKFNEKEPQGPEGRSPGPQVQVDRELRRGKGRREGGEKIIMGRKTVLDDTGQGT